MSLPQCTCGASQGAQPAMTAEQALDSLDRAELGRMYLEKVASRKREQEAFLASELFQRMLKTLLVDAELFLDDETFGYFFERECQTVGWDFVTKEDVRQFFDAVGADDASTVVPDSTRGDDGALRFEHTFGLHVIVLCGQGTTILVRNAAAERAWQAKHRS